MGINNKKVREEVNTVGNQLGSDHEVVIIAHLCWMKPGTQPSCQLTQWHGKKINFDHQQHSFCAHSSTHTYTWKQSPISAQSGLNV